jgi:hypothetical protein
MAGHLTSFTIVFPSRYVMEVSKLRQQLDEAHLAWATEWKQRQQEYVIENIRFAHNPRWNKQIFSLQAARDGKIWFWRPTRIFVAFGGLSV